MGSSPDICYWKELWRLTSGFTPNDLIRKKFNGIKNQLEHGLCYYKPSSNESYTKFASEHKKFEKVLPFIDKLQQFMGLESSQTWDVFCHYLSSQYHGTAENALNNFVFMDIRINQLLIEVWNFYNSERMFMLKQLKLMFEYKNCNNIYEKEFSDIINSIGLDKFKHSLIKQFEYLVNENPPSKVQNGDSVSLAMQKSWMERNMREQVEVLLLILLLVEETDLTIQEFKQLFALFKIHNFGRQPTYQKYLQDSHSASILKIVYCEVALFYKIVNDSKSLNVRSIIQNIKEDIEVELIRLQHNEEHGALLLVWMLLLLQDPQGEELFLSRYQHFGVKALKLRVFEFLYKMITHSMFSDNSKCATIIRKSVFHILRMMCDKFDGDGSVALHSHVIELCAELLSSPELSNPFWASLQDSEARGVVSLWNTALEFFPYDFKTLSIFITGFSKSGPMSCERLLEELEILPIYTELYKPGMVSISNIMNEEDSVQLMENYYPRGDKCLVMRAGSLAAIVDRRNTTFIHFRRQVSYWRVLQHEIQDLLDETVQGQDVLVKMERVLWGIRALVSVLKNYYMGDDLPESLVGPCEAVFEVLVRFAHCKTPLHLLIAACLDVSTALVPNFTQRIYTRLLNIGLLPTIEFGNLSHEEYASGVSFQTSTLGLYLVNVEQPSGEYPILNSYLDMLFAFYDCNYDRDIAMGVLLPGLVFILREVFPQMSTWYFKTQEAKHSLTLKCVMYFLKISQLSPEQTIRPADLLLNKTCVFSLLNLENGMALLKLISSGEQNIQAVMEGETNWVQGPGIEYIKMIQVSMAVLMQVLRLKSLVREKSALGPLEHLIYTQPKQKDALKIVPVVSGYINHVFNQQLPNTACRLLRRFALEFQMSLLVCLDMSAHQIRTMFLERLRDESELISLKTVILEFVAACVEKQPGLTEAFFKVSHPQDEKRLFQSSKSSDCTDGILTYMAEYLAAVKNNTNSLYSPLLSRIMGLFHALWKNNMQILVKDLRENEDFWEYMCSPLFQDILPDIRAYSQIFNMMAIELFLFEGKVDKSLRTALEKLFSRDGKYLKVWVEYIFSFDGRKNSLNPIDEVPGWLSLLTSWKDFISIVIKYLPFPIHMGNKYLMVGHCLDTLNKEIERMDDGRTVVILSEMYAVFFSKWKEDCFDERRKYFTQISTLLNHTAAAFDGLHPRAKNCILAISTLSLNMLTYDTKTEKESSDNIIRSVCVITCSQLDKMYSDGQDAIVEKCSDINIHASNDAVHLNPVVLGLRLLEQCINVFKESFIGWSHWFTSTKLINKLVFFVSSSVRKNAMFRQTLAALNCLTAFARSTVSQDILYCDISQHLWLQLLPPKELAQTGATKHSDKQWQVNEWLQVYKSGIEFVTAMLENHGNFFSSNAILFVGVQEDYLNESILLVRQSLDMDALNLTNSALYFISELVKFENKWRQEHFQSMITLMRSISVCFHYCITMVLRPKGIHFSIESPSTLLTQDETDNAGPSPKVTIILNKLLELMHLSSACLKAFSPDLLTLLAEPRPALGKWQPLMELQFSPPKLTDDPFPQLTFGTVMSAVCFLTRSLNYNYHADEIPLNSIRKQGRKGSSRRRISGDESIRRRTFRSDSVTSLSSTTSTVTIGPSWLAALDKKLVLLTLESILTLLASQALLAAKDVSMSNRDKQFIRRELCTELPIFHDFVKKKVLDLAHPKNYLARKKFGIYPLLKNDDESKDLSLAQESHINESNLETPSNPPPPPLRLSQDSMRVSVVRKLHLDKTRTKNTDPMSTPKRFAGMEPCSPILPSGESGRPSALTSTPSETPRVSQGASRTPKHVTWDDISVSPPEEEELLDPVDPDFSPLSEVQIIEEDYFHFLSNVFLYFCQTDI